MCLLCAAIVIAIAPSWGRSGPARVDLGQKNKFIAPENGIFMRVQILHALIIAFSILIAAFILIYFSPFQMCIRALDKTFYGSERELIEKIRVCEGL